MRSCIYIILILSFTSCNYDTRKFTVKDFSKKRIDTLKPYKWKNYSPFHSYVMYNIKVKGYVDDTIKIKHKGFYDINLFGKIDTLIQSDYFGEYEIITIFDPYKANNGKLEIEYDL